MNKEWPYNYRYIVCFGEGQAFTDMVREQIENGFTPLGGVSILKKGYFVQALWLPKPKRKTMRQWLFSVLMEDGNGRIN